jgi:hypothetical protein
MPLDYFYGSLHRGEICGVDHVQLVIPGEVVHAPLDL